MGILQGSAYNGDKDQVRSRILLQAKIPLISFLPWIRHSDGTRLIMLPFDQNDRGSYG